MIALLSIISFFSRFVHFLQNDLQKFVYRHKWYQIYVSNVLFSSILSHCFVNIFRIYRYIKNSYTINFYRYYSTSGNVIAITSRNQSNCTLSICKNGDTLSKVLRSTEVSPTNTFKIVLLVRLTVSVAAFSNVSLVIFGHPDKSSSLNCGADSITLIIAISVNWQKRHSSLFKLDPSCKFMSVTNSKQFISNTSNLGRVAIAAMPSFVIE